MASRCPNRTFDSRRKARSYSTRRRRFPAQTPRMNPKKTGAPSRPFESREKPRRAKVAPIRLPFLGRDFQARGFLLCCGGELRSNREIRSSLGCGASASIAPATVLLCRPNLPTSPPSRRRAMLAAFGRATPLRCVQHLARASGTGLRRTRDRATPDDREADW